MQAVIELEIFGVRREITVGLEIVEKDVAGSMNPQVGLIL
jgi:hypothetical protein